MSTAIQEPVTATGIKHSKLAQWVDDVAKLCKPDHVVVCDGSEAEYQEMLRIMVQSGTAIWMNSEKRPNSIFVRSTPADVARVEDRTYICSATQGRRRSDQQLARSRGNEGRAYEALHRLDEGRTMYVIPYSMGPIGSPIAKIGVEITDSPYVVANMHIMARVGIQGSRRARRKRRIRHGPALGGRTARSRTRLTHRGRTIRPTSTSAISPRPARSGRSVPVTAAMLCLARSATRFASPLCRRVTRAGSPSTCSSSS